MLRPTRLLPLLLMSMAAAACGPSRPPRSESRGETWSASLVDQAHPLVGKIWVPARHAEISKGELQTALGDVDYVLLGETHDNPDHHRLQSQALSAVAARGRHPIVAFEMLEPKQQALADAFMATQPRSMNGFGDAVQWDKGWSPWRDYAAIGTVALSAQLKIRSANIALEEARAIATGKVTPALPTWDAELDRSLVDELVEQHCGMVTRDKAQPMALAQRARDAKMAEVLLEADSGVLIAGAEHVRTDRGAPFYLRIQRPQARVLSVAFVEVQAESISAEAYARYFGAGSLPFDFVWFTPRAQRTDPCEMMHREPLPR